MISDRAQGEIRAEYRSQWILIYFPAVTTSPPTPAGVDILSSSNEALCRQTMEEISAALGRLDDVRALGRWSIYTVSRDRGRDKEMEERKHAQYKEWQNRTGPDLTYKDSKGGSKCLVQ